MTSYSVEYSCILFRNFRSVEEHLKVRLRAPEKHIVLHSACSGASGSFWKDRCGCSELLSRWVMTSEPFYILLMYHWQSCQLIQIFYNFDFGSNFDLILGNIGWLPIYKSGIRKLILHIYWSLIGLLCSKAPTFLQQWSLHHMQVSYLTNKDQEMLRSIAGSKAINRQSKLSLHPPLLSASYQGCL
jgi:hypothetical protein